MRLFDPGRAGWKRPQRAPPCSNGRGERSTRPRADPWLGGASEREDVRGGVCPSATEGRETSLGPGSATDVASPRRYQRRAGLTSRTSSRGADESGPSERATPLVRPHIGPLFVGAVDRVGVVTFPGDGVATRTASGRRLHVVDVHGWCRSGRRLRGRRHRVPITKSGNDKKLWDAWYRAAWIGLGVRFER